MGRDAILSKKRVLNTVDECVKVINETLNRVDEAVNQHNALLPDLEQKFTAVHARLDAQGAIGIGAEDGVKELRTALDELRTTVTQHDESAARAFRIMGDLYGQLRADVRDADAFIAQVKAENTFFESLTLWGRVASLIRWIRTGRSAPSATPALDAIPTPLEGAQHS
jgi:chromosome segregation ATPase